jgi:formylglycine-generating enzyme required for sulfatase activity/predicted esterase
VAYRRSERGHWAREQALPEIATLTANEKTVAAFQLIQAAEPYLTTDSELARLTAAAVRLTSIESSPPGATVEVQDYLFPREPWLRLGVTPLDKLRVPAGYLRWKVSKPGSGEIVAAPRPAAVMKFDLAQAAKAPKGMVLVDKGVWGNYLAFLGIVGPYDLPAFFIDRFEVTNREYQEFVDHGGYAMREYWKEPFVRDGHEAAWADAMAMFRDATGRPGPSTWEAGHYPEGKADFPVSGVSWYEAAAYAEFAGKRLPVIAQGYKASPEDVDKYVMRLSNLSGQPARVGQFEGLGLYGTYDLVGSVREWYWNATNHGFRFLLGRQASSYGPEALSPFDRSPLNGFRCVRNTGALPEESLAPRPLLNRDFTKVKPAPDDQFRIYRSMYAYDRTPLEARVQAMPDATEDWTRQRLAFNAAYGNERMAAYLFLPKGARPPFQVVFFFPSARVNLLPNSAELGDMSFVDYVIKSGRAVIYPIWQGLYERHIKAQVVVPGRTLQRDVGIAWSKDLGRSIDYLETRTDIDASRIGYLGVSQGAAEGVYLAALEDRLKAVVLLDGGYYQHDNPLPGRDQVDFAPRLTKPVLMVNGRYDATFPYASAQEPLFQLLGTSAADKRHVVFDSPHDVRLRRDDLIREVLAWYDKYLGPVK